MSINSECVLNVIPHKYTNWFGSAFVEIDNTLWFQAAIKETVSLMSNSDLYCKDAEWRMEGVGLRVKNGGCRMQSKEWSNLEPDPIFYVRIKEQTDIKPAKQSKIRLSNY